MGRKQSRRGRYIAAVIVVALVCVAVALLLRRQPGGQDDSSSSQGTQDVAASFVDGGPDVDRDDTGDSAGSSGAESEGVAGPGSGAESEDGAGTEGSAGTGNGAGSEGNAGTGNGTGSEGNAGTGDGAGSEDGVGNGTGAGSGSSAGNGSEADSASDVVEKLMAEMTLEEKVYQLFVIFPSAITGVKKVTQAGETTRQALEKYPVGGLIYDKSNMVSKEQVRTMLENVQSYTKIPLILTCDEEGGRVSRLMSTVGTTQIGPMFDYREEGASAAEQNAGIIAGDLTDLGFNMDLAPVADVWSNPQNTVIGDRAYSDDFKEAAELVAAAVSGFREGGVACTLKHFPGHGDTSEDSHYGSAYVYKTLDDLRSQELLPFQAGIDAGADAVMMGHLIITDVEEEPALFSYRLVTELLREEMNFQGVVITDSLQMQAMTDYYGNGEIVVRAVKAGVDMLLCPGDLEEAANALIQAVESGEISQERLDESVRRILKMKQERGILQ